MPLVLTEQSDLECIDKGKVKPVAKQVKLKIAGAKVLVDGDLSGALISACPNSYPPSKPCQTITSAIGGVSTKLKVAGKGVLLETIQGQTDGTPSPRTWSVIGARQSKLKAP